ncbi:hypothetical protein [Methylobacterium sp. J-076]|uniref:hypothetical protein n=1 Tax=Methylobacterium sp. J-076 TaxID=2836655 RepID=UPI001FBACB86|nr:hypothetical protein [Methylobacterium sp. J-076]MCJ2012188.1 hypothetical protein [Methylobacterium sp. J-076]
MLTAGFDFSKGGVFDSLSGSVGAVLGSSLVSANGIAGSIAGSVGSYAGGAIGTALIPIPIVGSFIGDVIGTLIGNLFGSSCPPTATVVLGNAGGNHLGVVAENTAHGGNSSVFNPLAGTISGATDAVLAAATGRLAGFGGTGNLTISSRGSDQHVVLADGGVDFLTRDAGTWSKAAGDAVLSLARTADIGGGDPIMLADLGAASHQDSSIDAVAGDLQIAKDYKTYLANTEIINLLLATNPNSSSAIGWQNTLLRAQELGLNQIGSGDGWSASLVTDGGVDPHTGEAYASPETILDNNGVITEDAYFHADGTQTDYQYYRHQTVTLSGVTIKVVNGATYTVLGSGNTISGGHDVNLTVAGDQNGVSITGAHATVSACGRGSGIGISGGTVNVAAGSSAAITGEGDAVHAETGRRQFGRHRQRMVERQLGLRRRARDGQRLRRHRGVVDADRQRQLELQRGWLQRPDGDQRRLELDRDRRSHPCGDRRHRQHVVGGERLGRDLGRLERGDGLDRIGIDAQGREGPPLDPPSAPDPTGGVRRPWRCPTARPVASRPDR